MKTRITIKNLGLGLITVFLMLISFTGYSQSCSGNMVTVSLQNFSQTSNTVEFDIYLANTGTSTLMLSTASINVLHNSNMLPAGATGSTSIVQQPSACDFANYPNGTPQLYSTTNRNIRFIGTPNSTPTVALTDVAKKFCRMRITSTLPWTQSFAGQFTINPINASGNFGSQVQTYCNGNPNSSTLQTNTTPASLTLGGPYSVPLNAIVCATAATASNETAVSCFGLNDGSATVTLSPIPTATSVNYTVDGGAPQAATLVDGVFSVSGLSSGSHSVTVINANCANVTANVAISSPNQLTNLTTAAACQSYTWAVNGETYTATGIYTGTSAGAGNCIVAETLDLTITPNTTSSETVDACGTSYTWAQNGETYTTTGTKTYVDGCHTYTLVLKITPSSTATVTETACGSYTWPLTGETYDQSGVYTFEDECAVTNLDLTITPSTSVETTETACVSFLWSENGETYTQSGHFSYTDGCHSAFLHLTIAPLSTYYVDADGDGFGSNIAEQLCSETAPQGYATNYSDCDDANPSVSSDVVINVQPESAAICTTLYSTADFSVEAEGPSLTYQWQFKLSAATAQWTTITVANAGLVYTNYTSPTLTVKRATTALPAAGTQYRVIVSGGTCAPLTSAVATISIESGAIAKAITGASPVCLGGSKTLTYATGSTGDIQWQSSTDNINWNDEGAIINSTAATNAINVFTATDLQESTWFRVMNITACSPATSPAVLVTVNQPAFVGTITATTEEVCTGTGTLISLGEFTGTITWQKTTYLNGVVGTAYTAVANSATTPITNGGLTLGTGNLTASTVYRALVTSGACPSEVSNNVLITVSPKSVAKTISGAGAICSGTSRDLTYSTTGSIGDIQWQSNVSSSATAPLAADANWTNIEGATSSTYNAAPNATTWYRVAVTSGSCSVANSVAVAVTVGQPTSIASISANATSICTGTGTTITLADAVGTIVWSKATVTAGVPGAFTAITGNSSSVLNTGNLTATTAYRATVSSGICTPTSSEVVIITVSPIAVAKTITGAGPICNGMDKLLTYVTAGSVGTIQWLSSTDGELYTAVDGATSATYSAAPTATTWYKVQVTSGACDAKYTPAVQIIVNEAMSAGTISGGDVTVCKTSNATALTLSNYNGAIQWEKATSLTGAYTLITAATAATYTATALAATTYIRAKVTNACGFVYADSVVITVSPASVAGTIAGAGTVCLGNSKTLTLATNVGTPQWQSSTDAGDTWNDITDAVGATYVATPSATTSYRVVVTSGACSSATSTPVVVTVDLPVQAGAITNGDITVCSGVATDLTLVGNSDYAISWFKSINGTTWTAVALATTATLNTGNLTAATWYKAKITNGTCSQETGVIKVSVTPVAKAGKIDTNTASVCLGGDITFTLTGAVGSSIQWQSLTSATNFDSAVNVGNGEATYTVSNASGAKLFIRAVVSSELCTVATTAVKTIVVNPTSVAGTVSGGGVVCSNGAGTLSVAGNVGAIQWQSSTDGLDFVNVPTGDDAVGTNYVSNSSTGIASTYKIENISDTVYFRARITSGLCTVAYSNVVQYTIGTSAASGSISASATTLCTGSPAVLTLSNSIGSVTWQKTTVSATGILGTTWANVSSSALAPITNNGTTLATGNLTASTAYRATVTIGSCDTQISEVQVIIVNPASKSGIVATNTSGTEVCSGGSKAMKVTGNVGAIQWQSSTDGVEFTDVAGATTTPYTFTNITANTSYRVIATSGICAAGVPSNAVAITLSTPAQAGTVTGTANVCTANGTTLSLSQGTGIVTWQKAPVTTGVWIAATGGTFIALATGNLTASTKFRAVFTSGACVDYSNEFTVTVSPAAKATTIAGHTGATTLATAICTTTTRALSLVGTTYVGTIQWQSATGTTAPAVTSASWSDIQGATSATHLASATNAGNVWYRVRFTSSPCSATVLSAAVNVWFKTCAAAVVNNQSTPVSRPAATPFSVKAYPNPFGEYFTLGLETSKSEMVMMSLYDMTGKLLENKQVEPSNIDSLQFGQNLPAGIYNMIVVQGSEVKTVRVVKK